MRQRAKEIKDTAKVLLEALNDEFKSTQKFVRQTWPALLLLALFFVALVVFINPPPPKRIAMATGSPGSIYADYGERYKKFFAAHGITLDLLATGGAVENMERLLDPKDPVQIAFFQGGLIKPADARKIQTMGSIGYEPIWLFYRHRDEGDQLQRFMDFAGRRIAIGPVGGGTHAEAMHLFGLNNLDKTAKLITMRARDGIDAIGRDEIDAIFVIDGLRSENIKKLVSNEKLRLANFVRADAYVQQVDYLEKVIIPMGGLDLLHNSPPQDTQLLATTTDLVIKEDLHEGVQMLLMQAAKEINGKESPLAKRGAFPSFRNTTIHESQQAALFYQKGPPFLMNYLPFGIAEFIHRMFFYLLPVAFFAIPLIRGIPERWDKRVQQRLREKLHATYGALKIFERELGVSYDVKRLPEYLGCIDALEHDTLNLEVPDTLYSEYYMLRTNIHYVRTCLEQGEAYKFSLTEPA
ncbi:MAG: TAXI family TRAP transporter solute-binding subunit [Rhodoferax sp.]